MTGAAGARFNLPVPFPSIAVSIKLWPCFAGLPDKFHEFLET